MLTTYEQYDRLISFVSIHHAIRAERLLAGAGIRAVVLPTPREIDISCGQCLLFAAADEKKVITLLSQHKVLWSKLFSRDGYKRVYEKLVEHHQQ